MTNSQLYSGTAVAVLDLPSRTRNLLETKRTQLTETDKVAPVVVFIVAVAVLLALGMTLAAGIAIYCIAKGYRKVSWYGPNGWKVWQMRVACEK